MLNRFSRVRLFATPWTVVRQTTLSMGFSRQEYWSRLRFPPLGALPETKPISLASPALAGSFFTASLVAETVKNSPAMQETWVPSPDQEDPLEEGMATHSSILAQRLYLALG